MQRNILGELIRWKESANRKPLILNGARQVGKTYILQEFGKLYYKEVAYLNCDRNEVLRQIFAQDYDTDRIIRSLSALLHIHITPGHTLIIFDEIQENPIILNSLKYFYENAPEYHIAVAGSLLGISLHGNVSFPVGKVDMIRMFPMTFDEFLLALGQESLVELLRLGDYSLIDSLSVKFIDFLRQYYFVGGMPAAVLEYAETGNLQTVRAIQQQILFDYRRDFSKHAPTTEVPRINMVWDSIPSQLAKENKKFIYGLVREGARAKDYETAIMWLSDCGLVHKVSRVNAAGIPLRAYEDLRAFKLFVVDVGLLGCMAGLRQRTLLDGNDLFVEFKGALTEQYVCQQLKTVQDLDVYYYTNDRGSCEVDFVVDTGEQIIPVEAKAEVNLRAKSLKTYQEKFSPEISIRTSMADYKKEEWLINLPLYAIDQIKAN